MKIDLMMGDCLLLMERVKDGSVDLILCDLPYGTTDCKWDAQIPIEPLWTHYKRIACINAGRNFVGMELDSEYFAAAERRIKEADAGRG